MRKYRYFVSVRGLCRADGTFIPLSFQFDQKPVRVRNILSSERAWSRATGQKTVHWLLETENGEVDLFWNGLNAFWIEIPVYRPELMIETDRMVCIRQNGRKR